MSYKRFSLTILLVAICGLTGCQSLLADELEPGVALLKFRRSLPSIVRPFVPQAGQITWNVVSGPGSAVAISNGTVTVGAANGQEVLIRSQQTISTDFFFEVTLPANFGSTEHLPYIGLDPYPITPTGMRIWGINSLWTGSANKIRVDSQSQLYDAVAGDRIAMEAKGGVVRYYKNYSDSTSVPFYVSRVAIPSGTNFNINLLKPIGGSVGDRWIAASMKLTQ